MEVEWTRTALANLREIVEFIEQNDPQRAASFALDIQKKTNHLAQFPSLGRPGRVAGTRELVIHPNYIIPYAVRTHKVEILRVLHVVRRWPTKL